MQTLQPHLLRQALLDRPRRRIVAVVLFVLAVTLLGAAHISTVNADTWPGSDLTESYKSASQHFVIAGQVFTYTIELQNSGTTDAVVTVTDPLPSGADYVSGSATQGGVYDASTRTLTWSAVTATLHSGLPLAFEVTAGTVTSPTVMVNTATISGTNVEPFQRSTWVFVIPESLAAPNLEHSAKFASRDIVGIGEAVTYKINLINTGLVSATASITDPLPAEMNYVDGSVTGGGTYDPISRTLSWSEVNVPPWEDVSLSFVATATTDIVSPTIVTNVATIATSAQSLARQAVVLIVPHPIVPPPSILSGSFKSASRRFVGPGETFTYTIRLINSGETDALATVTDPLPPEVDYVTGSASNSGVYDPGTRTLTWDAVSVLGEDGEDDDGVALTFAVMATTTITQPTAISNEATISVTGGISFTRHALVELTPNPVEDGIPPVVHSVTIDDQDVLTSPTVTLHISATDNISVSQMFIREWQLAPRPFPHWSVAASSGWVPYQADYPWTLTTTTGVHYVGVWVADAAHNISELDRNAIDFASLTLPDATVNDNGYVPYLVYYNAGVTVTAMLTPTSGNADLFVWYPRNFLEPDEISTSSPTATQSISFTTPRAGTYVFLVHGEPAATYDLTIEPGGGPRAIWPMPLDQQASTLSAPQSPATTTSIPTLEPILSQSGLDPLATAPLPDGFYKVYLPLAVR